MKSFLEPQGYSLKAHFKFYFTDLLMEILPLEYIQGQKESLSQTETLMVLTIPPLEEAATIATMGQNLRCFSHTHTKMLEAQRRNGNQKILKIIVFKQDVEI